jgi:hypothetical protein
MELDAGSCLFQSELDATYKSRIMLSIINFVKYIGPFTRYLFGDFGACMFVRKEVFHKVKGFNERMVYFEDSNLVTRLIKEKIKYKVLRERVEVSSRTFHSFRHFFINTSSAVLAFFFGVAAKIFRNEAILEEGVSKTMDFIYSKRF